MFFKFFKLNTNVDQVSHSLISAFKTNLAKQREGAVFYSVDRQIG